MSIYLIFFLVAFVLSIAGLWGMFEKAGQPGWKILIPFYNFYIWLKIIDKPMWWYIFLLIPFINVFTIMLMVVEFLKNFHKFGLGQQALAVLFPFVYLPYLGFSKKETFTPTPDLPKIKKSWTREWVDAIIFAVIAATIIRTFLIEAYTIPTSSMEKSMLVGDFLFVSKVAYGPKVPNTPIAFPFVHHTLPLTDNTKSYLEWIKLPYYRFPGLNEIDERDVVVFNFPAGDTVATKLPAQTYYSLVRHYGRDVIQNNPRQFGDIVFRPVDKRENYVKRCTGLPGDTLEIKDRMVYINGKKQDLPEQAQYNYVVLTNGTPINQRTLEKYDITEGKMLDGTYSRYQLIMTEETRQEMDALPFIKSIEPVTQKAGMWNRRVFPHDSSYAWNIDNFGPLYIPKAGETVDIDTRNIVLYRRIIEAYEHNDLEVRNGQVFINGEEADSYTFEMDYYWMMGDNRHNSLDSRFWGFVPMDHIVGKASFVWLSLDYNKRGLFNKIRFNKMFRVVK